MLLMFGNERKDVTVRWAGFRSHRQSDPTKRGHVLDLADPCVLVDFRVEGHDEGFPVGPSPGVITVSGFGWETTLDPTGTGNVWETGPLGELWEPGDGITASAEGDELPGFLVKRTIPSVLELVTPDLAGAAEDEIHISRSSPYELIWTPTDGTVEVEVGQSPVADRRDLLYLICMFPGANGAGTLPVEGLAEFKPDLGDPDVVTTLWVSHDDLAKTTLGDRPFWYWSSESRNQRIALE